MAFSRVTTRSSTNTNFQLSEAQKKIVNSNIKNLNSGFNNSKWCKVTYSSYMTNVYGIPYKKTIGRYEVLIAPDTHIFLKEDIAKHFDPKMIEPLSNEVAKGYGLKVAEKETETNEEPKSSGGRKPKQ